MATTGIIDNALGTPGLTQTSQPEPSTDPSATSLTTPAATTTYTPTKLQDPTKWTTSPDQTVAGQVTDLISADSPIIQQARSLADQRMNSRGLQNSSIAIGAANAAAYDVALPIAQADAANASKVAGYNADQQNQFAVKDQDTSTQVGLNNAQQSNQVAMANIDTQTKLKIQQLDQAQQTKMQELETANKNLLQNSSVAKEAYNTYANTLYNNSVSTNMDAAARFQADQNAFNLYQQQISLASFLTNVPDVSSQLIFTGLAPGGTGAITGASTGASIGPALVNANTPGVNNPYTDYNNAQIG